MKEKKFRLNWVDGLIVLVVIGLVAGTWLRFNKTDVTSSSGGQTPITYQVFVGGVRQYTVDAIRVGDTLYDNETDRDVGTISAIEAIPANSLIQDTEGGLHWAEAEGRYDLYLTIEATGSISEEGYTVNRVYSVNVGSYRHFYTKYSAWQGRVWSILS